MKVLVWENSTRWSGVLGIKDIIRIVQREGDQADTKWTPGKDVAVNGSYFILGGRASIAHALTTGNANFVEFSRQRGLSAYYARMSLGLGGKTFTLIGILDEDFERNLILYSRSAMAKLQLVQSNGNSSIGFLDLSLAITKYDAAVGIKVQEIAGF